MIFMTLLGTNKGWSPVICCVTAHTFSNNRPIRFDSGMRIVRVACGGRHNLALGQGLSLSVFSLSLPPLLLSCDSTCIQPPPPPPPPDGRVYSWGHNEYAQLGHSLGTPSVSSPTVLSALEGVPVCQVAAGGGHSFAVTISGHVFGWGRNKWV